MRKLLQRICAFALMLCMLVPLLTGCAFGFRVVVQNEFDALLDQLLVEAVSSSPLNYKMIFQDPEAYGLSYESHMLLSRDILQKQSEMAVKMRKKALEAMIEEIEGISPIILREGQRAAYYTVLDYFKTELRYVDVVDHGCLIAPIGGFVANLGINFYEFPFDSEADVKHYLKFLSNIPSALEIVVEHTEMQVENGRYAMTDHVKNTNSDYLKSYMDEKESPFLVGFEAKINICEFLDADAKKAYIAENKSVFQNDLVPSFKDTRSQIQKITLKSETYLGATEEGKRYYQYLLESESGTDMTVEEMEKYLKSKLATNMGILRRYVQEHGNSEVYLHGVKVSSAEDVILQLQNKVVTYMPTFQDPGCTITDLPEALSVAGVLAYYCIPAADNTTENIVRLNRAELGSDVSVADLVSTIAHESYPGHLFQVNYWRQNDIHPLISWLGQKSVCEGWAEYISIEALGWLGATEEEVECLRASMLADRILVMLADLQVNYYGKSGEDLNTYLCANLGISGTGDHFSYLRDVLVADPCSYAAYTIGSLQVLDLAKSVSKEQKNDFDQRAFYEAFLMAGACSFENIEMQVYKRLMIA